jgi:hypothetical protein
MNRNESTPSLTNDERVLSAVRKQQRWLHGLTALAVAFWVVAVIGGVGLLVCYSIFYEPKEKQIMADYERYGHVSRYTNSVDGTGSKVAGAATPEQALALHFTMNYVVTKGLLAVVMTMIVLSCGTLTTLLVVVLNRRVTLKQINQSLAQISEQLRQLESRAT